jgi:diguanylate cyclase (GGDEF)-like protein
MASDEQQRRLDGSLTSLDKLFDERFEEQLSPGLIERVNEDLLKLLEEVKSLPYKADRQAEHLAAIRALLIKATHSVAVQSEILSRLRLVALTDEMTGLYNRRGFLILGTQQLKVSRRNGQSLLLFFVDVDGLKTVNDVYGHNQGDVLLTRTAEVISETFREADIIARMGGDEFSVLAGEGTDRSREAILQRLKNVLRERNVEQGSPLLSLSLGVVRFDAQSSSTLGDLLSAADQQMYNQKRTRHPSGE